MKGIVVIVCCAYYLLGSACLPSGDFAFLVNIPAMYDHCKSTEDKDMTPFDFITDHLINFDCLFDSHGNGDEQKPHQSPQKIVNIAPQPIYNFEVSFIENIVTRAKEIEFYFIELKHPLDFINAVFRPPIGWPPILG